MHVNEILRLKEMPFTRFAPCATLADVVDRW